MVTVTIFLKIIVIVLARKTTTNDRVLADITHVYFTDIGQQGFVVLFVHPPMVVYSTHRELVTLE